MSESGLFILDLEAGRQIPGKVDNEISGADMETRFGRFFWHPEGTLDPIFAKLAYFCGTTDLSENSPANLGAVGVRFHRPPVMGHHVNTEVLGRSFRKPKEGEELTSGVAQGRSVISHDDGEPVISWTRQCIVNKRQGETIPKDLHGSDSRQKAEAEFSLDGIEIPKANAKVEQPAGALAAEDFEVGKEVPTGTISVLTPDDIFWLTRGLGNKAHTHYTRDSGYIVWGLLTLLYGARNFRTQFQCSMLLGLAQAKHTGPVYLTEQIRADEHAGEDPAPPEFLSASVEVARNDAIAGRDDVRHVTAKMVVRNHINSIGRAEYESRAAKSVLGAIENDALVVGRYDLELAVFTRAALAR